MEITFHCVKTLYHHKIFSWNFIRAVLLRYCSILCHLQPNGLTATKYSGNHILIEEPLETPCNCSAQPFPSTFQGIFFVRFESEAYLRRWKGNQPEWKRSAIERNEWMNTVITLIWNGPHGVWSMLFNLLTHPANNPLPQHTTCNIKMPPENSTVKFI